MSHSIIETAVTKRTLHLELTYRAPSMPVEEEDTAELEVQTKIVPRPPMQPISDEFACLLSVL
jgi:hypothetical protein